MPRTLSVRAPSRGPRSRPSLPAHVAPMLATLAGELPRNPRDYTFEWKWDGVRALTYFDGRRLRLDSRNLLDITTSYPELHALTRALDVRSVILDGEIVALDETGKPSFKRLQRRMHVHDATRAAQLARTDPVWYVLFDVLHLNGRSLLDEPYTNRREILERLTVAGPNWQVTSAHVGEGRAMLQTARREALEGIVAKRLDSKYEPGRRSPSWLKIKTILRQEFVIGGWVPERTGLSGRIGALLIGYHDATGALRYAGKVGTGLSAPDHPVLLRRLAGLARPDSPFAPSKDVPRGAHYVMPSAVAEIEYRRWPPGGLVQQAAFKGLREDKPARVIVREAP